MSSGNSKAAFSTLNQLTRPVQTKSSVFEDADGNIFTDGTAVLRNGQYRDDLYNFKFNGDNSILNSGIKVEQTPNGLSPRKD